MQRSPPNFATFRVGPSADERTKVSRYELAGAHYIVVPNFDTLPVGDSDYVSFEKRRQLIRWW